MLVSLMEAADQWTPQLDYRWPISRKPDPQRLVLRVPDFTSFPLWQGTGIQSKCDRFCLTTTIDLAYLIPN